MKKILRFFFIVFLFLSVSDTFSQSWQWLTSAGGDKSDKGLDIDMDRYGNLYVSGYYNNSSSGNVMFSSITAPVDFGKDAFLARMDVSGNWIWMQPGQGGWDERALGMCVDKMFDAVYVTGTCWYNTNFGSCPIPTYPGGQDNIFLSKLDLNGNCQWLIEAGSASDDHGYDVVTDKAGSIYLTGFVSFDTWSTNDTAYFGTIKIKGPAAGDSLGFIAKLSPSGNFQWVKTFEGIDGERDNRIAIDDSANVYITGGFYGVKAYDTQTLTSNGDFDIFVLKYDSSGTQKWARSAGGLLGDRGNSITVDGNQNVYVTGEFRNIVVFGPDTVDNYGGPGGRDIFVAKITSTGNWKWASKAGSSGGSDRGNRIISNKKDLLVVTGQIKGSSTFGSNVIITNPADSIQAFVAGLDTAGIWKWVLQGGGHWEDRGNGLAVDQECNVYVTGYFQDTVTFGTLTDTSVYRKDIFVAKLASDCNIGGIGIQEYEFMQNAYLFPNPSSGSFNIYLGRPYSDLTVTVYNAIGQELQNSKLPAVDRIEINPGNTAGIYFIRLSSKEGFIKTFKAIKE